MAVVAPGGCCSAATPSRCCVQRRCRCSWCAPLRRQA